jgi:hypothetical protein
MRAAPLFRLCALAWCGTLLPACTETMRLKFDSAWETLDPMGHRSEHQARNYPRGKSTGIKLPGD